MELVVDKWNHFQEFYQGCLQHADKRVDDWFLMQGYTPTLVITVLYLVAVKVGIEVMKTRQAFNLKYTLFIYNMGLVALNFHIFYEIITASTKRNYSYTCQPVDYSNDPDEMRIAKALWWYYFSKCVEFLDTIFFVLRKKNGQVSFLHVYHHASMFPIWWIGVKWVPGGQSFFGAMMNSFIHVIMYTYYGIAALGPEYQKYLWWKRYLTKIQLLQFFVGMVYATQSLYYECDYPRWMQYMALGYGVTIITLFLNFYIRAYIIKCDEPKIQFVAGMYHAAQSLIFGCNFPAWMQWALIFYGLSILSLFLNFYFQTYIKKSKRAGENQTKNGHVQNGDVKNGHISNGDAKTNGRMVESKKIK